MSSKFIQSGSLAGAVSSQGTLQANVASQGELKATISANGTLQGNITASETLQGSIDAQKTLNGTIYMSPKETAVTDVILPKIGEVTLLASAWVGEDRLYHQVVEIEGVTENSQVDLTPDVQQLMIFYEKDLTFVAENEGGTVTVYAIGQKPTNDYTIQVTITEVDI